MSSAASPCRLRSRGFRRQTRGCPRNATQASSPHRAVQVVLGDPAVGRYGPGSELMHSEVVLNATQKSNLENEVITIFPPFPGQPGAEVLLLVITW